MKPSTKLRGLLAGILAMAVSTTAVTVFSVRRLGETMQTMVEENLASVRAAEELEIALLEQKGLIANYLLDGGRRHWLEELNRKESSFYRWLGHARAAARSQEERLLLDRVDQLYERYDGKRESIIGMHDSGRVEEARELLVTDLYNVYSEVFDICETFIAANERIIQQKISEGRDGIRSTTMIVGSGAVLTGVLAIGLLLLFYRGILRPLRRMALDAGRAAAFPVVHEPGDELRSLGVHLRNLMSEFEETRAQLQQSSRELEEAERLAAVGRLAAGVAHEIRNPLTSIRMRIYALKADLEGHAQAAEDLEVASTEIDRLEATIRHFLEFSRPPAMRVRRVVLEPLCAEAVEFLRPLVESRAVELRKDPFPEASGMADPDQIRQVLINLIRNAVEGIEEQGGCITLSGSLESAGAREFVVVRVHDTGQGIPEEHQARLFEPFFSTKDEGIGLGLCIAAQIMAQHGGKLELQATGPDGTTFAVWVPVAED